MLQEKRKSEATVFNQYISSAVSGIEDLESLKKVEKLIENSSDNSAMTYQLAWRILTHPQIQKKNLDLALKAAKKAHEISPDNAYIMYTCALALAMRGETDKAIAVQKKAITMVKNDEEKRKLLQNNLKKIEAMK